MTMSSASPLSKPLQIGRLYKSATSETRATDEGYVTDELLEFYAPMVRAGTQLIVTGNLFVSLQAKSAGRQAGIDSDDKKSGLREWVQLAHSGGSLLVAQLNHGGRQMPRSSDPGKATVSASSVREPLYGTKPRPLRVDEIPALVETFAAAAARAQDVGFDGVQIHAAHGYLLSEFLTPHTNRRNDEYGGSLDNRMRLLREVYRAIRARVGDDYPILLKMNRTDMLPLRKGATTAELVRVAKVMADDGTDAVEISRGHYESWPGMVLGHYKGFITAQVKEGSGTKMSRQRRMIMLALAPIMEHAAEHLAPEAKDSISHRPNNSPPNSTSRSSASADFTPPRGCNQPSSRVDVMRFQPRGLSSPTPTCSRTYRCRRPEYRCADTATGASPASAESPLTATTMRSAPRKGSCFVMSIRPEPQVASAAAAPTRGV
jgi:2,4-dienoyl-CoA reductase-like NADH-dependent reductase (Old Yellow Enzyme family)